MRAMNDVEQAFSTFTTPASFYDAAFMHAFQCKIHKHSPRGQPHAFSPSLFSRDMSRPFLVTVSLADVIPLSDAAAELWWGFHTATASPYYVSLRKIPKDNLHLNRHPTPFPASTAMPDRRQRPARRLPLREFPQKELVVITIVEVMID